MTQPTGLELGQVSDPYARRALEQLSTPRQLTVPIVNTLPRVGRRGQLLFQASDLKLYLYYNNAWRNV